MTVAKTSMPDLLGRHDHEHGEWQVKGVTHGPGQAWTAIGERKMQIPHGDTTIERAVRAHEMMHAKVSPTPDDMKAWNERGRASHEALVAVEEARVNYLIGNLGFDIENVTDGSETQSGEFVAENNRWEEAVMATVAFAGTGRIRKFLVGVRRHNPEWAKTLRTLNDKVMKELKKVPDHLLTSTARDDNSGLNPIGFRYTEAIATMVDVVANPPQDDTAEASQGQPEAPQSDAEPVEAEQDGNGKGDAPEGGKKEDSKEDSPITAEAIKGMNPDSVHSWWDDLRIEKPHRPRRAAGGIGTKRRAASIGKNPRRVGRMLTDPYQRVFDAKKKGKGGVVVIDASGSMALSRGDISAITEAAPGCLVVMYASSQTSKVEGTPNFWVLADKGTMVDTIPDRPKGNGVDAPAIRWAIQNRQRKDSPVVWVTDGLCHGPKQRYTHNSGVECVQEVLKHGVIVRPTVETAVKALQDLSRGKRPPRWYPIMWVKSWEAVMGRKIVPQVSFGHERTVNVQK